jgi:hypothetical protein
MTGLLASDRGTGDIERRQTSLLALLGVVGIVALDLAFARVFVPYEPWRVAGVAMIGLLIQVGLVFLFRARGMRRRYAFWAGFEVGALVGFSSFFYVRVPGSTIGNLWGVYGEFIDGCLSHYFGISALNRGALDPVLLWIVAVFAFLPQLCMAVTGGVLALSVGSSARARAQTIRLFAITGTLVMNVIAWLAAWNALPAQPPWLPFGITPGGLLLELGTYGLVRTWGRPNARTFWLIFLAVDSLVLWSYLDAMVFHHVQTAWYFHCWTDGPLYATPIRSAPLWTVWIDYTFMASYILGRPPHGTYIVAWPNHLLDNVSYTFIILVPHLLAATVGGALAAGASRSRRRWNQAR